MSYQLLQSLLVITRFSLLSLVLAPALALAASARGAPATTSPWLQALSNHFVVIDMAEGDLDGDGRPETAVCYQESEGIRTGGIAILKERDGVLQPGYHVRLDETWCEQVKIQGDKVGFLLKSQTLDKQRGQLVWQHGKDFDLVGSGRALTDRSKVEGSSSLGGTNARAAFDGNIATSWAESASGTGIGEKLTIKLPKATDIAYVAIYGGHGGGSAAFQDNNRVHRASIATRTEADLGDALAGIDFSDLGIDSAGDRVPVTFENRAGVTFVKLYKPGVTEIEVRIDSVFLGRKKDDTHIAEVEVIPLLRLSETLDRAKPLSKKDDKKKAAEDDAVTKEIRAGQKKKADDALDKLDSEGRGLEISDEF